MRAEAPVHRWPDVGRMVDWRSADALVRTADSVLNRAVEAPPARELVEERSRRLRRGLGEWCEVFAGATHPGARALVRVGRRRVSRPEGGGGEENAWLVLRQVAALVRGFHDLAVRLRGHEGAESP